MKPAEVLVIGGTGTVGREVLRQLSAKDIAVRALVRSVHRAAPLAGRFVDLVEGDLSDTESIVTALNEIKRVFVITPVEPDVVDWMSRLVASAVEAGVEHVVRLSALSASASAPAEILRQHHQSDDLLVQSGLAYTLLRPNVFFQNILAQTETIKGTGRFHLPFGDARQSMIDVRDIGMAAVNVLTDKGHDEKTYNLTGPEAPNYFEVAAHLGTALGRSVTYVPVSTDDAREALKTAGLSAWQVNAIVELQAYFALGQHALVTDDFDTVTGQPARSFARFANDIAPYF